MKYLHTFLLLTIVIIAFGCKTKSSGNSDNQEEKSIVNTEKQGWVRIFDGETLNNWEITNFGPQGHVYASGGEIVLGMGDGCTGVTWKGSFPKVNYEVTMEAMRVSGNDFFCGITFPYKDTFCSFIVGGWAGVVVGLSTIDGYDGEENETTSMMKFTNGEWYQIKLKVSENRIEAWINEKQVVDFVTIGHVIDIRPEVSLSCPFGIATWHTTGALRNIYFRTLNPIMG